jgi:hypothetical protein
MILSVGHHKKLCQMSSYNSDILSLYLSINLICYIATLSKNKIRLICLEKPYQLLMLTAHFWMIINLEMINEKKFENLLKIQSMQELQKIIIIVINSQIYIYIIHICIFLYISMHIYTIILYICAHTFIEGIFIWMKCVVCMCYVCILYIFS